MGRVRIASRLALIVVGAIVLAQLILAATYFIDKPNDGSPRVVPLVEQTAALATLLDRLPPAERPLALRAAGGFGFRPHLRPDRPEERHSAVLRGAEDRLRALLGPPADRYVALSIISSEDRGGEPVTRLRDLIGAQIHGVVALTSGGYLEFEARGGLTLRLRGVPIGLIAGILGFGVALAALIAVRRETKPLSDLAAAVERFGSAIEPQPVAERGAPDVRALIRAVNAMQVRIADLIRSRTLVLGAISHDLRTYVTRLRLRLELMPESEQRQKVTADLDAMQALMDDALAFARASFNGGPQETIDFGHIVKTECEMRAAQGSTVTFVVPEHPVTVRGSPAGLARLAANLIDNALIYGNSAEVSLREGDGAVELWIEDRGPGIPPHERTHVFEPFYRLETSRNRERGGAGLGLTIVRQIVESLRGTVAIEDRPGGGLRLRVTLPRACTPPERPGPRRTVENA